MMPAMNPKQIMQRYFETWNERDFDAFEAQLAEDITFSGPLGTARGAAEYRRGMEGLAKRMTRTEVVTMVAEGPDVITWFNLHTGEAEPVTVANWARVEDGRIQRVRVAFDPRPLLG